jgi:aconitate hydratase
LVIAKSFARIHRKNLINYGILPLTFDDPSAYDDIHNGDQIVLALIRKQFAENDKLEVHVPKKDLILTASHDLTQHMIEVLLSGGLTNWIRVSQR